MSTFTKQHQRVFPQGGKMIEDSGKKYIEFPGEGGTGVMLAEKLYHTTGTKAGQRVTLTDKMLKEIGCGQPGAGWYASEKYDGLRGVWTGKELVARPSKDSTTKMWTAKVFTTVPSFFQELLPPGVALDGEVWMGRGNFQKVSGLSSLKVTKKNTLENITKTWEDVVYKVFDSPSVEGVYEERMAAVSKIMSHIEKKWNKTERGKAGASCPIRLVVSYRIKDDEHLMKLYTEMTKSGAEGVMVRAPRNLYEAKRSKLLLKMKVQDDAEAVVQEYMPGTGRLDRKASDGVHPVLGALKCVMADGTVFNIGTGMTDEIRANYWDPESPYHIPIGSTVNFSYMELTGEGVPRHPAYRGVRTDVVCEPPPQDGDFRVRIVEEFKAIVSKIKTDREPNYQFKLRPYNKAIKAFESTTSPITTTSQALDILRQAGEKLTKEDPAKPTSSVLKNVAVIIRTGTCTKASKSRADPKTLAVQELTKIPHVGDVKAGELFDTYNVTSVQELRDCAPARGSLTDAQSLGLEHFEDLQQRIPRSEMDIWNQLLFAYSLGRGVTAGSYRRGNSSSGDVDFLCRGNLMTMTYLMQAISNNDDIEVLGCFGQGRTQWQGVMRLKRRDFKARHVDIFCHDTEYFGFALLHSTGSGEFNVNCRKNALDKGLSLSQYGFKPKQLGLIEKLEGKASDEAKILEYIGMKYVEPNDRK